MNYKDNLKIQLERIKKKNKINFQLSINLSNVLINEINRIKKHNKDNPYHKIPLPDKYHFEKLANEHYNKIRGGNHCLQQFSLLHTDLEDNNYYGFQGSLYLSDVSQLKDIEEGQCGVYMLYDIDDVLLYVGESTCMKQRVRQHLSKYDVFRVGLLFCQKKFRKALETFVISTQVPLHNSETRCFYQ